MKSWMHHTLQLLHILQLGTVLIQFVSVGITMVHSKSDSIGQSQRNLYFIKEMFTKDGIDHSMDLLVIVERSSARRFRSCRNSFQRYESFTNSIKLISSSSSSQSCIRQIDYRPSLDMTSGRRSSSSSHDEGSILLILYWSAVAYQKFEIRDQEMAATINDTLRGHITISTNSNHRLRTVVALETGTISLLSSGITRLETLQDVLT
jgi:hypothetical protein